GGLQLDVALERLDLVAHDVHADAASRDFGDRSAGGETVAEDELVELGGQHRLGLGRGNDVALDGDLLDAGVVETASVVGDLDEEHVALLLHADDEGAFAVLAAGLADLGRLDAVIDGVADEVDERPSQRLQDAPVERQLAAHHGKAGELAGRLADVAHG